MSDVLFLGEPGESWHNLVKYLLLAVNLAMNKKMNDKLHPSPKETLAIVW